MDGIDPNFREAVEVWWRRFLRAGNDIWTIGGFVRQCTERRGLWVVLAHFGDRICRGSEW